MKLLKMVLNNQKQRTAIIISAIFIFIMLVGTFIEAEIDYNRQLTIRNFVLMQQLITNQAAKSMESEYSNGNFDINTLIKKIIGQVTTSGNSYWFVARDQELLFVKDEIDTKLYADIKFRRFLRKSKASDMKIVFSSFNADNRQYTIGNCTKVSYIKDNGQLFRHHIYIIMPLTLISLFFFVLFIIGITKINEQKNKITYLKLQLKDNNILIEELSIKLKMYGEQMSLSKSEKDIQIYSKEVFDSLLDKINKEKIIPLIIAVVEFNSNKNNMDSENYKNALKSVPKILNTECVLSEIIPDVFAVLLLNTTPDQNESIRETLIAKWADPLNKHGIKVRIGISFIEDNSTDVKSIYKTICKEVYKEGSLV